MDYDIIIIGAGPGGYEMAAHASAKYGMKTALIEKRELGGTCLNRGCIPTKAFLHTTELLDEVGHKGEVFGFMGNENLSVNMLHLQKRKNEVVETLRNGVGKLLKSVKVDIYEGHGALIDTGRVSVENKGEKKELTCKHVVIATGSEPDRQTSLEGHDIKGVLISDEMLELEHIPESLLILGGGVIGMELASVFNSLGTKVTVLKASSKIFNNMDRELGQSLKLLMKNRGVEIITGANVLKLREHSEGVVCEYTAGDDEEAVNEIKAELVLLAKGRVANTDGIADANASAAVKALVKDKRGFISVDENFRTSVEGVYAIGDCISNENVKSHAQLAHVATAEGKKLLSYLNASEEGIDLSAVPSCIYTSPEIASVGADPESCKAEGINVITKKYPMGANGKSVLTQQDRGFIKVIADADTKKIIGASMMCARATDMISIFTEAIVNGLTIDDMSRAIFPHPTFCEGIGEALRK